MAADKVILGENAIFSTDPDQTGLNNNVMVCGGAGSGKTKSFTEPRLLQTYDSSLIVSLTKRRLVHKYKRVFEEERGYETEDLNFIEPGKSTIAYDPLQYIHSYADIAFLAKAIVKANPEKAHSHADPYWDDGAVSLLYLA